MAKKSSEKKTPKFRDFGVHFWGPFGSGRAVLSPLKNKCALHVGAREAGYIKMGPKSRMLGPKIDDRR